MCRALLYLGEPVLLDNLLFRPDSSLVNQAHMPRMLQMLNLAGFGMTAWDRSSYEPDIPYCYRSPTLPIFDRNLKSIASKFRADCVLAHVRGVIYSPSVNVSVQNTHPFWYRDSRIAFAHNGDLYRFEEMKGDSLAYVKPHIAGQIAGSTDSEWVYALLLSQLPENCSCPSGEQIAEAVEKTLSVISDLRRRHGIAASSSLNLFITNGVEVVAVRYCFDFGCYDTDSPQHVREADVSFLSMWYTTGREFGFHEGEWKMIGGEESADSMIIASEPLTHDTATWLEVPEYSILHGNISGSRPSVAIYPLPA